VAGCVPDKAGRQGRRRKRALAATCGTGSCRAGAARLLQSAYASPTCAWSAF